MKRNEVAAENNPHLNRALFALVALSLIWGYNWVVMKEVLKYVGAFDFSAMRTVLGALCLFVVLRWLRRPMRPVALKQTLLLGLLQTAAFTSAKHRAKIRALPRLQRHDRLPARRSCALHQLSGKVVVTLQ